MSESVNMNEQLFRKKSLDKVQSPESLNDYVRVANPGVWLILAAVIALLAGACIWGIFGRIETTEKTVVHIENGYAYCVTGEGITTDMTVRVDEKEYPITDVDVSDIIIKNNGEKTATAHIKSDLPDGTYEGEIVVESIKPISFIFN